ncbi:hypothetical protein LINPERPRIM_LOCUS35152 [Linum perenne]
MTIPFSDLDTSMPGKYFSSPRSLSSNSLANFPFRASISSTSSPVIIMLSTYRIRIDIFPACECFTNMVWSV